MACSISIIKYFVITVNFLVALCGIYLVVEGSISTLVEKPEIFWPEIIIGVIMFVISFLGCCGAIKESTCMLLTFGVILLSLFLLTIIFGLIVLFVFSLTSEASIECRDDVFSLFTNYTYNINRDGFIQKQLEMRCCGANGPHDFAMYNDPVPFPSSCCTVVGSNCTLDYGDVIQMGCLDACDAQFWPVKVIGIILIVFAFVELTGAICAICLANSIKSQWSRGYYT